MFEAYKIGVTLTLNNLVSPQLIMVAEQMERLEGISLALGKALKSIGQEKIGLKSLAKDSLASAAALDKAALGAERLERRLAQIRATAGSLGGGSGVPLLPGGGGGGGGRGGGHRNGFHGGNIHMGPGGIGLGTVGMAAGDAFIPLAIAAGMGYAGHALYESAKDLDTERARFRMFGLSPGQNSEAFNYVDGMRVYGSTRAENMRNFREAQGVFRESGESDSSALAGAKLAAPVLSQLNFLASAMGGDSDGKMATANMAMLRYVELSGGLKSAAAFNSIADFGWKLNQSSGGTVDWQQLLAFKKTAGSAGYNLSNDALARLEPIMAELSGGRAGTADATAYNRIMGITRIPNQVAHALVDNGLWDNSKISWNSQGGIKNMLGNPLSDANSKLFHENPELFYEQAIRPIYAKMKLDSDGITRENALIFGRTGGQFFNAIERAMPQIQKGVEAISKADGIAKSVENAKLSLTGQEKEFDAAWTDFKTQFGTTMLPFFTGILKGGANILRTAAGISPTQAAAGPLTTAAKLVASLLGFDDAPGANNAAATAHESPNVARAPASFGEVHTKLMLDGRLLATSVTKHQAKDAYRPQSGSLSYDPTFGMDPAGG